MQKGTTIQETVQELMRQAKSKADYTVQAGALGLTRVKVAEDGPDQQQASLLDDLVDRFDADEQLRMRVGKYDPLPITDWCHKQVAAKLDIPQKYYMRMLREAPTLLETNVNHWLDLRPDREFLIRTLDGRARAFMSTGYRLLDNLDVANGILGTFSELGLEIKSCQVTDNHFHIMAVSNDRWGEVRVGDEVQAGISIRNSEVGMGAFLVSDWLWRKLCENGMRGQTVLRQTHIGSDAKAAESAEKYLKSSTQELKDAALFAEARDLISGWMGEEAWQERLGKLQEAAGQRLTGKMDKVCEATAKQLDLRESEASELLRHLAEGGDMSKWGLANAVTSLAHQAESYDRNVELQAKGGEILEMNLKDWEKLQKAA